MNEHSSTLISPKALQLLSKSAVNTDLSVIAMVFPHDNCECSFFLASENHRTATCMKYVKDLFDGFGARFFSIRPHGAFSFVFDGGDLVGDVPCVSWQRRADYNHVTVVPDFYYTENKGYIDFPTIPSPTWADKESCVFWRGSTTGGFGFTVSTLETLPRFRICKMAKDLLFERADFKFFNVVQGASIQDNQQVQDYLTTSGMFSYHVPLENYMRYKYFVQIDGNGNSWELVKKLRTGSCMLLVESDWQLWHNSGLIPWVHYVPIKKDLSDFIEIVDWCYSNDDSAEAIAERARAFALSIDYDNEMSKAIEAIVTQSAFFGKLSGS